METLHDSPEGLEITPTNRRKWLGLVTWLLFFAAVTAVLVLLFISIGATLRIALGVVLFMGTYMLGMGYLAGGKMDRRGKRRADRQS